MIKTNITTLFAGVAMAAGLSFGPAMAFDEQTLGWQSVSDTELSQYRGGAEVEVDIDVDDVTVNAAGSVGNNTVSGGSFANAAGIITNIQNNGHGAVISNAINVDVTINPAP